MRPTVVMVVKYTCRLLGHALASNTCLYLINSKNKNIYIIQHAMPQTQMPRPKYYEPYELHSLH